MVAGRDLGRIDGASGLTHGAVHVSQVVRLGNVADGEPPHSGRVGRAREQQRLARLAVPARAPDHLHVALERVRVVEEADEPNVGLVDSHPERGGRDDAADAAGDEVVLDARALVASRPAW